MEPENEERGSAELCSVLGHDLRNPISAILMSSVFLLKKVRAVESDPSFERALLQIRHAAERLERATSELSDLGLLLSGELPIARSVFHIGPVLDEAEAEARPEAARAAVTLSVVVRAVSAPIHCDRAQVLKVLRVLLAAAIKHAGERGQVTLTVATDHKDLHFTVEEREAEIPSELRALLSDAQDLPATPSQNRSLGERLARGIVEIHGGRYWSERVSPDASLTHFTLPTI